MHPRRESRRAVLYPAITSLLFSGSYVAGKYTTLDLDPLTATLARYAVALVFLACLAPRMGATRLRLSRRDIPAVALLGLFGIVGYHYFFFLSLRYTAVANTAIINALSPVCTGVAAALLIKERLSPRNYAGALVALAGVLTLLTRGDLTMLTRMDFNRGDLYMLLAVACWVVYALLVKVLVARYSSYTLTLYATALGVAWLLALAPTGETIAQLRAMSSASAWAIAYMGVLGSGLGYLTYNLSIEAVGATRTSSFVYSVLPVLVAVLAFTFFDEPITSVMLLSAGLILFGLHQMLSQETPAISR